MALDLERAIAAAYYAAMTVDAAIATATAPSMWPRRGGRAAHRCAKEAIQLHGGIGYTWEHDLHLYLRRALAAEALLGTASLAPRPSRRSPPGLVVRLRPLRADERYDPEVLRDPVRRDPHPRTLSARYAGKRPFRRSLIAGRSEPLSAAPGWDCV